MTITSATMKTDNHWRRSCRVVGFGHMYAVLTLSILMLEFDELSSWPATVRYETLLLLLL